MLQSWKLQLGTALTISGAIIALSGNYALAQSSIVPDRTLDTESSTVVKPDAQTDEIRGGATRGTNLFHSFEKFSIPNNGVAHFNNAANIQNIITRVTGDSVSNIDGKLKANGIANVFLLNPNGIIFGANASLDIGGSFVASTASSLKFADGSQFSATQPQTSPLLTVSVPIGLQFGAGAGSITNRSVTGDIVNTIPVNFGLQVDPGKTLALVGREVALEGGNLTARAGRVELGSVAAPSVVNLTPTDKGWTLGYQDIQNFGDIRLSQGAVVNTGGVVNGDVQVQYGGDVQVQGRRVSIRDGSVISAISAASSVNRAGSGGTLAVNASESVELIGSSSLRTDNLGFGTAGDVIINTGKLKVRDGAFVTTTNFFQGKGGELQVTASDSAELSGTAPDGAPSSLFTQTQGAGDAGDLSIETGKLTVRDEAEVSVSSQRLGATGKAGNLEVVARDLRLDNRGQITATAQSGRGGNIELRELDLLLMRRNSLISAEAPGAEQDGNVNIDADLIVAFPSENSDIISNAFGGSGGNIGINAQGIFGTQIREGPTEKSDIVAIGKNPPDLSVEFNTVEPLPPAELVDVAGLVVQGCSAGGGSVARGQSEFIITGRGGLPPTPRDALGSEPALVDLGTPTQAQENSSSVATSNNQTSSSPNPIVEAQGWVIGANGEVVLTATAPGVTPHSPWLTPTNCYPS